VTDPVVRRVRDHRAPAWWRAAKLGIFVHWTPASVPGFAPVGGDIAPMIASRRPDALGESPYTEWYENSMRFPGSSVARYHAEHYGDRPYEAFAADFEAGLSSWDPSAWARAFRATGAGYVVLVTKHHDGWCLWPTGVANPHRPGWHAHRDIVGELAEAVRGEGMRFGVYYSGGLDSRFEPHPVGRFSDLLLAQPRSPAYLAYADAQLRELILRYRPSILWGDISWPGDTAQLAGLLNWYYEQVPDGAVNDRFVPYGPLWRVATTRPARWLVDRAAARAAARDQGLVPPKPPLFDFRTPEYTAFDEVQTVPWECTRGMDHSFGYNRASGPEDFLAREDLLWSFADVVAKGGNLLLNVGPRGEDATIPDEQLERLGWLARFMADGGRRLVGSEPHTTPGVTAAGCEIRYVAGAGGVVAVVRSDGPERRDRVVLAGLAPVARVCDGHGRSLEWEATALGPAVRLPEPVGREVPVVVAVEGAPGGDGPPAPDR
jgi:alpha-L-fucosidase